MQGRCAIDDPARRRGCPKSSPDRADRARHILLAKQTSSGDTAMMTVRDAGRKGGLSCLRNHGRGFFAEIGRKGQSVMRARHPDKAREWGRLGGRPRKPTLEDIMGAARK